MIIKTSEFIISAVKRPQYPVDNRVEIAFVGRSNVGKSSIINALTNRRKLAKVSQTPGKTRLINFFLINNDFYLVDSRHKPTADDIMMYEWIKHYGYDVIVVATKSDKLSNNEHPKAKKLIKQTLNLQKDDKLYFFSSLNKKGKDELIDNLFLDLSIEGQNIAENE